jgi:DNA polymerase
VEEDEQGEPFVGQAGKLLDAMMAALGIKRGREAYIANVVKCRPPGNRTPTPEEAAACAPFLDRQIELISPKVIVALGKTAAMRLLQTEASLGSLRGRVHRYRDTPLVVTYHPAYLLRTLPDKAKAWEDLLLARRTLRAIEQATGRNSPPRPHYLRVLDRERLSKEKKRCASSCGPCHSWRCSPFPVAATTTSRRRTSR